MSLLSDIRTYLAVGWSRVRIFFNRPLPKDPIPQGHYCYQYQSDMLFDKEGKAYFNIKTCPYFHYVGKNKVACTFLAHVTDDIVFADQCKICGEKEEYPTQDPLSKDTENS